MKKLILIAGLLFGLNATAQEFTLIEINAKWNAKNHLTFTSVDGVEVKKAFLEDQPPHFAATIRSVPTLILYVDGRLIYSWQAGIDLKCPATPEQVAEVMSRFKK
jgi:hypothetical protein